MEELHTLLLDQQERLKKLVRIQKITLRLQLLLIAMQAILLYINICRIS